MKLSRPSGFVFALAVLAAASACPDSHLSPFPDDDDVVADDDDVPDDDDDDATDGDDLPPIGAASFAASFSGQPVDVVDPMRPETLVRGMFHLMYWGEEASAPVCRFQYEVTGAARFEIAVNVGCKACIGELDLGPASLRKIEGRGCENLPADVDLGFLMSQDDEAPTDLRSIRLVLASELEGSGHPLGEDLTTDGVIRAYADAGFQVEYFGLVSQDGWLAEGAALAEVAEPWDETRDLPMFVLYRESSDEPGAWMTGETFIAGLWTIRLRR